VSRPSDLVGPLVYESGATDGVEYLEGSLRPSPEPGFGVTPADVPGEDG
jgi:hypothetical protein